MPRAVKLLAVLFVVALGTTGCTGTGRNAPSPQEYATVLVNNRAFIDVNVYALDGSSRVRLGTVTASGTGTFRIPAALVGSGHDLRFMVDPIGSSREGYSFNIYVRPGERVTLTVPSSMAR
jgi:hypothetical protein